MSHEYADGTLADEIAQRAAEARVERERWSQTDRPRSPLGMTVRGNFVPAAEMAAKARDQQAAVAPPAAAVHVWTLLRDHWRKFGRTLPCDSAARKEIPIESGFNKYFPAAIVCIAAWSKFNNNKHNPGEPLHHSRNKSSDHEDCIARHNIDIADAVLAKDELVELEEATAVAWRACTRVQLIAERMGAPPAPAARFPETPNK